MITPDVVIRVARDLRSETGENPEYDRALVEMTSDLLGFTQDDRPLVENLLFGDRH